MKSFVEVDLFLELIQGRVLLLDRPLVLLQAVDLLLGQLATVVEEVVHELSPETKTLMGSFVNDNMQFRTICHPCVTLFSTIGSLVSSQNP